jgi:hypothetical protein
MENGKDNIPIEDNSLEPSNDSNYCLRSRTGNAICVILHIMLPYVDFCIAFLLQSANTNKNNFIDNDDTQGF